MSDNRRHILIAVGTRPEAIKLGPLIESLKGAPERFRVSVASTGQHREMLVQALSAYGLIPDLDLAVMTPDQTLAGLTTAILAAWGSSLADLHPELVVVQGDTTTAFATALAAFYNGIPVAHVEAGLRTGDIANPFPEEMNRRLVASLASLHFAPTASAAAALRREGVASYRIHVTGNTIVDAVLRFRSQGIAPTSNTAETIRRAAGRLVLVTCHRRESFGSDLNEVAIAVRTLAERFADRTFFFPLHLNPRVRAQLTPLLEGLPNILLTEPVPYADLLAILDAAELVITDSGGIQEEAPSFGVPVIVVRRKTERPEGLRAGFARLVPPDREQIIRISSRWLRGNRRAALRGRPNPYGDGHAAARIREILQKWTP